MFVGTCTCTVGVHNWYTTNSYLASTHVFAYDAETRMQRHTVRCRDTLYDAHTVRKYYIALLSMFVTHCTMQRHTVQCRDTLYDALTHCTMQRHAVRCSDTLYDAVTHCTMQRHAVRCSDTLYDDAFAL